MSSSPDPDGHDFPEQGVRIDELARRSGLASTTIRLYQQKGLLPGPRLVGRTGFYDQHHLTRLRLIERLQADGHSLAGIGRLLETWQEGRDLADLVGVEDELDALLHGRHEIVLDPTELAGHFPVDRLDAEVVLRAVDLGLLTPTDDGRFRVPDRRFLDIGGALIRMGIPPEVVLDEWEALRSHTDDIARRFAALFESHLLPEGFPASVDAAEVTELAEALARLRHLAGQAVLSALDTSVSATGAERLAELLPHHR